MNKRGFDRLVQQVGRILGSYRADAAEVLGCVALRCGGVDVKVRGRASERWIFISQSFQ